MLDTSGGFFPDKLKEHVSMELFGNLDKSISTTNPRPFCVRDFASANCRAVQTNDEVFPVQRAALLIPSHAWSAL